MIKKVLFVLLAMALIPQVYADKPIFTWQEKNRNVYSDTPKHLKSNDVNEINIRTHQVSNPNPSSKATNNMDNNALSLEEQQINLNQKIAEENKRREEEHKKREAQIKEENCRTAKINLNSVEQANRLANKEDLSQKYQSDISKYCN